MEDGVKQLWQGIKGLVKESAEGGKTGVATLQAVDGRLVSSGKGKR